MANFIYIGVQNRLLNEEFSPEEHVESLKEIEFKRELERYKLASECIGCHVYICYCYRTLTTSLKEENEELKRNLERIK